MSKQENMDEQFAKGSIGKLLFKLAFPAIVAQLINALYNIVDRMYIGNMPGVGDVALTGVGVTFPIIILISAFAALVGMGGAPLAAIRLGEGNREKAEEIMGNSVTLLLGFAVVLTVGFTLVKEPLLYLFGASSETFSYANDYITLYVFGTVFVMLSLGLNAFINTQGFAKTGMLTVLIGAVINIALDPILIYGLGLGVRGAAIATVFSQMVSALWVFLFLTGKRTILKIRLPHMRLRLSNVAHILPLGLSPFIMQSTESLVHITFNKSLLLYGGNVFVGAMTILGSIMQVFQMPIIGLTQGAQPIIGYNYGAGNYARVKKTMRYSVLSCAMVSVACWAFLMLAPELVIGLFNDKPELVQATVHAMRIYMSMLFILGLQFSCQNAFVALGHAKISIFLALLRKIILLIPLVLVLPLLLPGSKVDSVLIAEPVADTIASLTTFFVFIVKVRRLKYDMEMRPAVENAVPDAKGV